MHMHMLMHMHVHMRRLEHRDRPAVEYVVDDRLVLLD